MVRSVALMLNGTVALIFACVLGVTGHADGMGLYRDAMAVEIDEGVSFAFGGMIFAGSSDEWVMGHEYGHLQQERIMGALYVPVIGLLSMVAQALDNAGVITSRQHKDFWPESWATRLGGQTEQGE